MELSIYDYRDYRDFLSDSFNTKKEQNSLWSFASWARVLNLNSPSTLSMIVAKKRHAGPRVINALVDYFNFSGEEEKFFRGKINSQKGNIDSKISIALDRLPSEFTGEENLRFAVDEIDYIINHNTAILYEMINTKGFIEDGVWIRERLRYPLDLCGYTIEQYLEKLVSLNVLKRDSLGKLMPNGEHVVDAIPSRDSINRFHQESLDVALMANEVSPPEASAFATSIITIKKDKLQKAKGLLKKFHSEFSKLADLSDGDEVVQMSVQLFPLTKNTEQTSTLLA